MSYLNKYFMQFPETKRAPETVAFLASLDVVAKQSPKIAKAIVDELKSQRENLKLIASENFCSLPVQFAMGNLFTDKYSEGFAGHRFYAGCENVDFVEEEAVFWAKKIFKADHAYVQPHSGADANLVAFWAILVHKVQDAEVQKTGKKINELSPSEYEKIRKLLVNQKIMGMGLASGGHLTHGYLHNISGKIFQSVSYDVDSKTGLIDYKALEAQVKKEKPLILLAGYSAYPRKINFAKMREIADQVGATLLVDMAHFAGLVAGGVFQGDFNPVPFADVLTTTTHKTLRGPRGGLILCKEEYRDVINKGCPLVLGGPLPHVMAAKAVAFQEASKPEFSSYAHQVVKNAQTLAEELISLGVDVLTKGTDNHLLLINTKESFQLSGRQAERVLREAHLTVNRNMIPNDTLGPWHSSGVRLGTPAMTTLGMKEAEMKEIANILFELLQNTEAVEDPKTGSFKGQTHVPPKVLARAKARVTDLLKKFPLYPELIID